MRKVPVARLGFVDQTELARWADSIGARSDLPRLIRRLVLETGHGVVQLGFPGGEGIATGGWDGTARATEANAFVPAGLSLWELSVEKNANTKADKDFAKRLATPDGSPTNECTYIAVSLRRWAKRSEWTNTKSSEGRWKVVRGHGVDDLETWLESAPITHAWLSELLGLHPHGLLSAETWWASWSAATEPLFPAAAVLAGRKNNVDALRSKLAGPGQVITIQGASYDDVIAFISALALMDADIDGGLFLSRMALIDKVEAWRRLRDHPVPLVLVPRTQEVIDDLGRGSVHHLIVPIVGGRSADITLQPIDSQEVSKVLAAVGLSERLARETGNLARLSLLAARRRLARKPELHRPSWAIAPVPRLQRRALLVGRWDERSAGDVSLLHPFFGTEYEPVSEEISALILAQDPIFARFGSSIGLVSHFDAWLLLKYNLRKEDLEAFQAAASAVFGELNPALDLSADERWMASVLGKAPTHSNDLRLGMATALALLGAHGSEVITGSTLTGQDWASWTLQKILQSANQDNTCRLWISLRDVLTLFAEAAPKIFLEAVRDGLQGEPPLLRRMFTDGKEVSAPFTDSPHSSLLWALEVCSWSPADFGQTVDVLARLAEVDPGGRLANRPSACLVAIFRPIYPQSGVTVESRLAALDGLRTRHPSVAWSLMISLLPERRGFPINLSEPLFRDWKPQEISVTWEEYWKQIDEICLRLLKDSSADPEKWVSLLGRLPSLPSLLRARVLESLHDLGSEESLDSQARDQIWESLRALASHYRDFNEATSALPSAELVRIEEVTKIFQPIAPSKQLAWLFNEYMPDIPDVRPGSSDYDSTLTQLRTQAAAKISKSMIWPEIHSFAIGMKLPWSVGISLAQAAIATYDREMLALLDANGLADIQFASGYLSKRFQAEGWSWLEHHISEGNPSPEQSGRLLLVTGDFPKAWEVAEATHAAVAAAFWKHFQTSGLGPDFPYVETAAQQLLQVGRPADSLHLLVLYGEQGRENERADLVASCLEELLRCDPEGFDIQALSRHDFIEAFSCLGQSSISIERLAKLEWAYLGVFGHHSSPPALSRHLAQSPGFFVDVVSEIYRPSTLQGEEIEAPNSDPKAEGDKSRGARRMNAYQLLSGWRTLPGVREDGTVDGEFLKQWVDESRQLLRATHRLAGC